MRYLLIILSLLFWSCEEQGPEEVVVDLFNYDKIQKKELSKAQRPNIFR